MTRLTLLMAALAALAACNPGAAPNADNDGQAQSAPDGQAPLETAVSIMTFNVENLFDTTDDPGKDDKTYLPLSQKQSEAHQTACADIPVDRWREECLSLDWNDEILDKKLAALAETIRQQPADIIAFQEVENAGILNRLSHDYLGDLGYGNAVLIEGQDLRGIDVAFLSKLPIIGEPVLHPVTFPDHPDRQDDTRGVLEATFELPDGQKLTGFAVHFPAPFHPTAMRDVAYRHLNDLRAAVPDDHHVFAAGDFNTTADEFVDSHLIRELARPYWTVAHELGCGDCKGTNYYARNDSWSFLDLLLWSPARGENATWQIRANSVRVANGFDGQLRADGTPNRFNSGTGTGVSDHFPLLIQIQPTQKQ